jgi:hypothetical protein
MKKEQNESQEKSSGIQKKDPSTSKALKDNENPEVQFKKIIASKKTSSTSLATAKLVDLYLNKPTIDIDLASFDPLNWWKVDFL